MIPFKTGEEQAVGFGIQINQNKLPNLFSLIDKNESAKNDYRQECYRYLHFIFYGWLWNYLPHIHQPRQGA